MSGSAEAEIIQLAQEWDRAMVTNDADAIGRFVADEWTIISSDGSECSRARFLELVRSGTLTHNVMESHEMRVRIYGDTAVLTARGVSGGSYQSQPFREVERATCVFVRRDGQWLCVLTHLSCLAQK